MDFKEHLKKYLNEEQIDLLINSFDNEPKRAALLNTRKMSDETFVSLFPNVKPHPLVKHCYLYDKNEYDLGKSIYHFLGCFYLQEPSAAIPSSLLDFNKEDIVLDMCGAPGGKSIQASFKMNNKGLIISNDLSRERCFKTLENIERLGIGDIIITNNDLSLLSHKYQNYFSKIILDAPCSGSGMFRKDIKMREDWSYNKVLKFQSLQKELILLAYDMLLPGGEMVYSTCSYSYEEDEEVIKYLLDNREIEILEIKGDNLYQDINLPYGVHTFPYLFEGEGHYVCHIKKKGDLIQPSLRVDSNASNFKDIYLDKELSFIQKFGDALFGFNSSIPSLPLFNIIRFGVKIGEYSKGIFKYDHHYSHYLKDFEKTYQLNDEELTKYLKGDVIRSSIPKGYVLLLYKDIPVAFGKSDGVMIKNHLPKGLKR